MVVASGDDSGGARARIGLLLANRYQIEELLGEGAMGAVYRARHVKVGRPFAVKVLHKKLLEDNKMVQRFEREAELAGRLSHPNVVGVVDIGDTPDGSRYMVMDFAEGTDLATLLSEAPMPPERVINLTRQMLEGLFHAHEQELIHRDFKPENVIVARDDHGDEVPRIVDFGIAILREGGDGPTATGRLTTNGLVLGTPHYMAPEQAVADPIDHRIDLFALGIVIYEMLSGKLPFDGSGAEVARANLLLDPPPIASRVPFLEVDPLLEAFARRLMEKRRDARPQTAKAARELLDLIINDRPAAAAALGVALASSSRQPALTEPVRPQSITDPDDDAEIAPEILEIPVAGREPPRDTIPAPFGEELGAGPREAPPVTTPVPLVTPSGPVRGRSFHTDVATPLPWDGPPPRRRWPWIAAGLAAAATAGAIALIVMASDDDGAAAPADAAVVATVTPDAAPIADLQPVVDAAVPVTDPTPPADAAVAVVEPDDPPPPRDPPPRPTHDRHRPRRNPGDVARTPPGPGSAVTAPQVDPPKPSVIDASGLYALYATVGADLKRAREVQGQPAIARIEAQYRLIQIQDAASTEAKRAAAASRLNKLRAQLAPLKQK